MAKNKGGAKVAKKQRPASEYEALRNKYATELRTLVRLIGRVDELASPGSIGRAADICARKIEANENVWGYRFSDLKFNIPDARHVLPEEVTGVQVVVGADFRGWHEVENADDVPIASLAVDIMVQGTIGKRDLAFTWHVDKHIIGDDDEDSDEPHPLFHIQHGGDYLPTTSYENGGVIFMDVPRLLHVPIDAVLAIDFVLANYVPSAWNKLRDDENYRALVQSSHERYWRPFFATLNGYWGPGRSLDGCYRLQPAFLKEKP